jgi:hypothetical protein
MSKKDEKATEEIKTFDPFVGAEDDDLMDMKYVQDADTVVEDTHPPATKEEAEQRAEMAANEPTEETEDAVQDDETQEVEAEAEAEAEAEVLDEAPAEEAEETDEPRIPKSRFDEVNQQKKKYQERMEKLEKQLDDLLEQKKQPPEPEPEPFDYEAKEAEAYDAFLEGDTKQYSAIQQEIRAAQKAELQREAQRIAKEGDKGVREEMTFEETGAKIEADYPQFVKTDESFNEAAYDDLMDLYVGYANTGRYSRAEALQMAADKAVMMYHLDKSDDAPLAETADNVVDIKKPDIKKKKAIADKQPPVKQSGLAREDEPSVDVSSMSDEEFESLPEATKRRIRGDVL